MGPFHRVRFYRSSNLNDTDFERRQYFCFISCFRLLEFTFSIVNMSAFKSQYSSATHNEELLTGYRWRGDIVPCMRDALASVRDGFSSTCDGIIHACILVTWIYGLL